MKVLFPGTFDPPTFGHLEIIQRAARLYDNVYIALTDNKAKSNAYFEVEERKELLLQIAAPLKNVTIVVFDGLVVDCALKYNADAILRGLRNGTDFDYEYQMASTNYQMTGIETIFMASSPQYAHLSSTLIRQIASCKGRLEEFVPAAVEKYILQRLNP